MKKISLRDLARMHGHELVPSRDPNRHPLRVNRNFHCSVCWARMLSDGRIAVRSLGLSFESVYGLAHEIAESHHGYKHTAEMFCDQSNILAQWTLAIAASKTIQVVDDPSLRFPQPLDPETYPGSGNVVAQIFADRAPPASAAGLAEHARDRGEIVRRNLAARPRSDTYR